MDDAGANLVHTDEAASEESKASAGPGRASGPGAISSVEERSVHTGKVSGSTPLSPTTPRNRSAYVYFIRGRTSGHVKIGRAWDVSQRFHAIKTSCSEPVELLGLIPSDFPERLEGELHARFRRCCVHGEWFRPNRHLLRFIRHNAISLQQNQERLARSAMAKWVAADRLQSTPVPALVVGQGFPGRVSTPREGPHP